MPANTARVMANGQLLELRCVRVMVKVEGLRSRTIVDHLFYNPNTQGGREGTFHYRLPENSSMCYFAFSPIARVPGSQATPFPPNPQLPIPDAATIHGTPVEQIIAEETGELSRPRSAYAVPRVEAADAYTRTVRRNIDPALIEWQEEDLLSVRVFPLPREDYCRVVLAYDQTLPEIGRHFHYEFVFPQEQGVSVDFALVASNDYGQQGKCNLPVEVKRSPGWTAFLLPSDRPRGADHISCTFPAREVATIAGKDANLNATYLYGRIAPEFPVVYGEGSGEAVFVLDTSHSQDVAEFGIYMQLMRAILEANPEIRRFNVLCFDVGTSWHKSDGWIDNTPAERDKLWQHFDRVLLEGATNVEAALLSLTSAPWLNVEGKPVDVFLFTNGDATWGETSLPRVFSRFRQKLQFVPRFYTYLLGLPGRNREFFTLLDSLGAVTVPCYGEAEVTRAAVAHKSTPFLIRNIATSDLADVLWPDRPTALYAGQSIPFAARVTGEKPSVVFHGSMQGQPRELTYSLACPTSSMLAPRAFGDMAVRAMEKLDKRALRADIIAFARYFNIPCQTCSLLMLERAADYAAFGIDLRRDPKPVAACRVADNLRKIIPPPEKVLSHAERIGQQWQKTLVYPPDHEEIVKLAGLLKDDEFAAWDTPPASTPLLVSQVPQEYLQKRRSKPGDFAVYLAESERRGPGAGYLRCLSTLCENKEAADASRQQIGYTLLARQSFADALGFWQNSLQTDSGCVYLNLATCYQALEKYGAAALCYEFAIYGREAAGFARQSYVLMIREMLQQQKGSAELRELLARRLADIANLDYHTEASDVKMVMRWYKDRFSQPILSVREPDGKMCCEEQMHECSIDHYRAIKAEPGKYVVYVQDSLSSQRYNSDANYFAFAEVVVTSRFATPAEQSRRFFAILTSPKPYQIAEIAWPGK